MSAAFAAARYFPHDTPLASSATNLTFVQPAPGPRKTHPTPPAMNNLNPNAVSFRPNYPPYSYTSDQEGHSDYAAQAQARAYYHQWAQYHGYMGYQAEFQPYNGDPRTFAQHGQHNYPYSAQDYLPMSQDLQQYPGAPVHDYPAPLSDSAGTGKSKPKLSKSARKKARQAQAKSDEETKSTDHVKPSAYAILRRTHPSSRINKSYRTPQAPQVKKDKKGKEPKIMLPAPSPTKDYLDCASQAPSLADSPAPVLVILDLNGTLLHRPSKNKQRMIARPFLKPFLRYLSSNFAIMVWSSARPENVKSLVQQSLDKDLQSKLVAEWARTSFGLSPEHYIRNVQVYKNLDLVWKNHDIQKKHPNFEHGGRFGQHNTVLIDDSVLKANAQPHNLLEITEFTATPEDMKSDVLREVAGYLEVLRKQSDVSKFINKEPFKVGGQWTYEWPEDVVHDDGGVELVRKISLKDG